MMSSSRSLVLMLLVAGGQGIARAQPDPKFEYGKADELKDVKKIEWNATAEAGLVQSTGNSRTTTLSGGIKAMRKEKENKLSIEVAGTFARASNLVAKDASGNGLISSDEITRVKQTSAKNIAGKLRYDRFLARKDAVFIAALGAADPIAGKDFVGGGQLGYARTLAERDKQRLVIEVGYDFSYENYAAGPIDSVSIHSARVFSGYEGTLSDTAKVSGSIEMLANVNGTKAADAFEDLRMNGKAELTTKVRKNISLSVSFDARFDNKPAAAALGSLMPDPANPPTDKQLRAEPLDTTTKASLIVTFL